MTYKNQTEKDSAIAALKAQLEEAEKATVSGRWKPNDNGLFFYLSGDLEIGSYIWDNNGTDRDLFATHNCFSTREEAQAEADKTLIWREFRAFCRECNGSEVVDWGDSKQKKWGIVHRPGKINIDWRRSNNVFLAGCAFVGDNAEANAQAALEKFGERLNLLTTA